MLHPGLRMSSAAIFAVAVSWSAIGTAEAETAGNSKSCLSGSIAPFDYALLDEDFHNLSWTGQSGVQVNSGTKTLTLTVTIFTATPYARSQAVRPPHAHSYLELLPHLQSGSTTRKIHSGWETNGPSGEST